MFYLCDRRACDRCESECKHTKDIHHAVNFEKCEGGEFWEKDPRPVLIFKTDVLLSKETTKKVREELRRQLDEGLILVDRLITEIQIKEDSEGKIVICQTEASKEDLHHVTVKDILNYYG